jgi:hypothetical protein
MMWYHVVYRVLISVCTLIFYNEIIIDFVQNFSSNDYDGFISEFTGPPTLLDQVNLDH